LKQFIIQLVSVPKNINWNGYRYNLYFNKMILAESIDLKLARDLVLQYSDSDKDIVTQDQIGGQTATWTVGLLKNLDTAKAIG
jgi:hypothetical protein